MINTQLDPALERGKNLVRTWLGFRDTRLRASKSQEALETPLRAFLEDLPGGRYVDADGYGAELADPQHARYLDFEHIADNLILAAAHAGLLTANLGAIDGEVKSSDLGKSALAYEVAQHLRDGFRSERKQLQAVEPK